jgi:hypothetical protein
MNERNCLQSHLVEAAEACWLAVAPKLCLPATSGEGLVHATEPAAAPAAVVVTASSAAAFVSTATSMAVLDITSPLTLAADDEHMFLQVLLSRNSSHMACPPAACQVRNQQQSLEIQRNNSHSG